MSKDDLRNLREKLGVTKKGSTLVGHATPVEAEPDDEAAGPEEEGSSPAEEAREEVVDDSVDAVFDIESTLQLSASDIEVIGETVSDFRSSPPSGGLRGEAAELRSSRPSGALRDEAAQFVRARLDDEPAETADPRTKKTTPPPTSPLVTQRGRPAAAELQSGEADGRRETTEAEAPEAEAPGDPPEPGPFAPQQEADLPGPIPADAAELGSSHPCGALREAAELYRREAIALADTLPERAGLMHVEAARALEHLGEMLSGGAGGQSMQLEQVVGELEAALRVAPSSPQVVALVRGAMARLGRHDQVLELTRQLVQLGGDNRTRIVALLEAAAIACHGQGDAVAALSWLQQALDLQAGQVQVLAMRAGLQLEQQQDEAAAESLEHLAESMTDTRERSLVLLTAGTLQEFRLEDPERAAQDYRRAVEYDPENVFALLALRDLHQSEGSWRDLCDDLERIATLVSDPDSKARYLLRAGSLHLDRTGDLEAAARALTAAAAAAPGEAAPLVRLAHVHEETGRYQELVEVLRRLLDLTLDPVGRPPLLCRIGWLARHGIGDLERAIDAYRQALRERAGYLPALLALGTLYRQRGDYEGLVAILAPETEGTDEPARRAVWCLELAEICSSRLNLADEAIRYYRRALELHPQLWVAFWRLYRLLLRFQRFDALAELLRQRSQQSSDPKTRNFLLLQLARLEAGPLNEIDQATETMTLARQDGGVNRVAAIEFGELYERSGQFAQLAELLLTEADDTVDVEEAKGRRLQAAALLEDQLGEHDRALEIYHDVIEQDPHNAAAIRAAGRMHHRLGRWKDLLDLHRHELRVQPDRPDAAEMLYRIGRLYEEHLGQAADAIASYMEALARDPGSVVALDALVRLIRNERRHGELIDVLRRHAAVRTEPFAAADALCRAAEIAESHLDDPVFALELYQEALERSPRFRNALQGKLEIQLRQRRYEEAAESLEQLIAGASSDAEKGHLTFRKARLGEYRLGQACGPVYDEAAQASPLGDRLRAERLRTRRISGAGLSEMLQENARTTRDSALAAAYWLELAAMNELSDNGEAQLDAAQSAFALDPEQPAGSWSLQRALRREGEFGVLAALLEQESEREPDETLRLSQLFDASLCNLRADQEGEAQRLAERCQELDSGHLPSLTLLAGLAARRSRWSQLAGLYDRLTVASEQRENRLNAALTASDVWAQRLADTARALASLQPALADDPGEIAAFTRAEQLLEQAHSHAQLSKLYARRIAACEDHGQTVELLRIHARLLHTRLADVTGAIAELGKLLALEPGDLQALSERADLLCSQGRWSDAAENLATLVEKATDADQRRAARLLQAQIWLNQLHDSARAREILGRALEDEPDNVSVKQGMVQVAFAEGKWEEARQLLDEVAAEDQPHLQVWALTRLAEVAHVGLRDEALRGSYEREALLMAGAHQPVLEQVFDRYRERGEQQRLVKVASDVLAETTRAEVASAMRLSLARVMLEDLNQPAKAVEWLRESLVRDPREKTANLLFARALEQRGDLEQAVARYRQLLEHDPLCAESYRGLSRLMSLVGSPSVATSAVAVLDILGEATPQELEVLEALDPENSPGGRLDLASLASETALHSIRRVFDLVLPHLGSVYPLKTSRILRPTEPVVLAATRLAIALGLTGAQVAVEGDVPAVAGVGDPVQLQIGVGLARKPRSPSFRFWVVRAIASSILGGTLTELLSDRELGELLEALFVQRPIDHEVLQLRKRIHRALPRRVRKTVEQLGSPRVDGTLWSSFRAFARQQADEIAMVASGDVRVALEELTGGETGRLQTAEMGSVLRYVVSEEYGDRYRSLWTAGSPV